MLPLLDLILVSVRWTALQGPSIVCLISATELLGSLSRIAGASVEGVIVTVLCLTLSSTNVADSEIAPAPWVGPGTVCGLVKEVLSVS